MDERGLQGESAPRPRAWGVGRAAKLVPPRDPNGTLDRPALEATLREGAERRLTVIVAGAGFGKSTLAARTARSRASAWYTVDGADTDLGAFAAGVVAALHRQLPALPEDLASPIASAVDPRDEAEAQHRGQAAATLVADAVQDVLEDDLLLVLDDCHEIDGATGSWRFVEALVRFAPPGLHVLLVSRNDPPFGVERLRAQGEVADLGGAALAFTVPEIETLVTTLLPADAVPREATSVAADRIFTATDGWPAAVRLTIEALRRCAGGRPGGRPRATPAPRRPAVRVPRRGGGGAGLGADPPRPLAGRPLRAFLGPAAGGCRDRRRDARCSTGWPDAACSSSRSPVTRAGTSLHGLIREYARSRLAPVARRDARPPPPRPRPGSRRTSAYDDALAQLALAGVARGAGRASSTATGRCSCWPDPHGR